MKLSISIIKYFVMSPKYMRFIFCLLTIIGYHLPCTGQTIVNPVFDRTDEYKFHVKKVVLTEDTTFVYCTYSAEEHSWANISDKTYLENVRNGERVSILKVSGIPFGPDKRHFIDAEEVDVILYFPHMSTDKINIIEDEEEEAFNIYGIDLNNSYESRYCSDDIDYYFSASHKKQEEENWYSALKYTQKQLEATNYVEGIRSFASACSMYNLTMVYFGIKDYEKMIEWGKNAIDILCSLPQDSIYLDVLARAYGNVSTAYYLIKKDETAEFYRELSLEIRRRGKQIGSVPYEVYLKNMARDYYYENNYPKAYLYGKEVASIYKTKFNENKKNYGCAYILALANMCEFCQSMDKNDEAIDCGRQALTLMETDACQDSLNSPWLKRSVYCNLAAAMARIGLVDDAINYLNIVISDQNKETQGDRADINARMLLTEILFVSNKDTISALNEYESIANILEDSISMKHEYASILHKLYFVYKDIDFHKSIQYLSKEIQVQKDWHGEHSIAYGNLLLVYAKELFPYYLVGNKRTDSLLQNLSQASEIVKHHINNSIYCMSKKDRATYWDQYKDVFTWLIPNICGMLDDKSAHCLAYDAALFHKGVMLSSEQSIQDIVQQSDDEVLKNIYQQYVYNVSLLENYYSGQITIYNVDSLFTLIKNDEFALAEKLTRMNTKYKGTDYSWKDVKDNLNRGDVAIEIIAYPNFNASTTYYDAYVINDSSKAPQVIYLFDEQNLIEILDTAIIDSTRLSLLIWGNKNLQNAINGAKNIYFSASGLLNTIGIEYLPISDKQKIYEKYNLYRLSSTRALCLKKGSIGIRKVCLYGGLDYNKNKEVVNYLESDTCHLYRSLAYSLKSRSGFDPLPGSAIELKDIKKELDYNNIQCIVFTDSMGTEESFKQLSGSQINLIHLSTHGMFIPFEEENVVQNNNFRFVLSDEADVDEEDLTLSRSFLVMSGGNTLIRRDSIPYGKEDGILTSLEISHLDFDELELVVLSACQTALGVIDSEGVYGLQRGFKKAGANTILMSLHKVDDEATQILMVEFYKNLMSGKSKRQSLKDAQKFLRQYKNGKYDDPNYWAAFIMLDGLD